LLYGNTIVLAGFNIWLTDRELHKERKPFSTLWKWGAKIEINNVKSKVNL